MLPNRTQEKNGLPFKKIEHIFRFGNRFFN